MDVALVDKDRIKLIKDAVLLLKQPSDAERNRGLRELMSTFNRKYKMSFADLYTRNVYLTAGDYAVMLMLGVEPDDAIPYTINDYDMTVVELLLKYGANPDPIFYDERSVLEYGWEHDSNLAITLMRYKSTKDFLLFYQNCDYSCHDYFLIWTGLELGWNVNLEVSNRTPIFMAAQNADSAIMALLMMFGADTQAKDKKGRRAIDYLPSDNTLDGQRCKMLLKTMESLLLKGNVKQMLERDKILETSPIACKVNAGVYGVGSYKLSKEIKDKYLVPKVKLLLNKAEHTFALDYDRGRGFVLAFILLKLLRDVDNFEVFGINAQEEPTFISPIFTPDNKQKIATNGESMKLLYSLYGVYPQSDIKGKIVTLEGLKLCRFPELLRVQNTTLIDFPVKTYAADLNLYNVQFDTLEVLEGMKLCYKMYKIPFEIKSIQRVVY